MIGCPRAPHPVREQGREQGGKGSGGKGRGGKGRGGLAAGRRQRPWQGLWLWRWELGLFSTFFYRYLHAFC